jgi:hypothetical protein
VGLGFQASVRCDACPVRLLSGWRAALGGSGHTWPVGQLPDYPMDEVNAGLKLILDL